MNPAKVSIVVPVYNVEPFIEKCLESILAQTYSNVEVLLIDDGSTDSSGKICDRIASTKNNWFVIHQNNMGLSSARNRGIELSTGDYIYFLDSDDLIHPQTIQLLIEASVCSNSEIVEADYFECEINAQLPTNTFTIEGNTETWEHFQALRNILLNRNCSIMACNKLIAANLLKEIRFPVGKTHEDEFTIPFIVEQVSNYTRLHIPLYAYVQRDTSIMHQGFSLKKLDAIEAMKIRFDYFTRTYPSVFDEIVGYTLGSLCRKFIILYSNDLTQQTKTKLKQTAQHAYKFVHNPKKLPFEQRVSFTLQQFMPNLFWKIVLFFEKRKDLN